MKKFITFTLFIAAFSFFAQETVKSKALKLKYTPPAGWNSQEFGAPLSWDESGNALCK